MQSGCFPAAFIVVALLAVLGSGAVRLGAFLQGLDVSLKLAAVVAVPLLFASVVARLRRR